jgi:hypothetical protein
LCPSGKQLYYAALVREAAARRAKDDVSTFEEVSTVEDSTFEELGRKSLAAFTNILDTLSGARAHGSTVEAVALRRSLEDQMTQISESVDALRRDLQAFASRTDRILLDLLKRVEARESRGPGVAGPGIATLALTASGTDVSPSEKPDRPAKSYERVPKEQTRQKILEAARKLAAGGKKVTLAECARAAGVAYYKAVYACKESRELSEIMSV